MGVARWVALAAAMGGPIFPGIRCKEAPMISVAHGTGQDSPALPPIDQAVPPTVETATFALG